MNNKKRLIVFGVILFLAIGAFFVNERRKSAAEKLTIPPIDKYFTEHNYQAPPSFVADASLFFNEDSISTSVGKDFNLIAKVNPGSNVEKGINAVQLDVNFDSAILEFSNVSAVEPFMQMGAPVVDNNKGTLSVAFFIGGSQIKSISDVANLTFKAKKVSADSVVSFASSAQVAANDGNGSMVLGDSGKASVKVSE
jgi:hypothetical protein